MCSIKSLDLIQELIETIINEGRRMSRIKSVRIGMYQHGISVGLNLFLSKHVAVLIHHLGKFSLTSQQAQPDSENIILASSCVSLSLYVIPSVVC